MAFATAWAGIACFEVAVYAGDALTRRLPLVSVGGGDPIHDWSYMLAELDLLQHTEAVALVWHWAGRALMTAGVVLGARVLWIMAADRPGPADAGSDPELAREGERLARKLAGETKGGG